MSPQANMAGNLVRHCRKNTMGKYLLPCKGSASRGHLQTWIFALPGHIARWCFDFGLFIL